MKAFVTGINGFLAARLATALAAGGADVAGSTSRPGGQRAGIVQLRHGMAVDERLFSGCDCVIHCAHDFSPGARAANVAGVTAVARTAQRAGVPRQIFVSSLSARADANSEYGRAKYESEAAIRDVRGLVIVRPGTILGNGGVFGRLLGVVRRFPVVPLIGGGRRPMQLVGIHDLVRGLCLLSRDPAPFADYNLYYEVQPSLREVVRAIERVEGLHRVHLGIPASPLLLGIRALERLGLRPPITAENLRGYFAVPAGLHAPRWGALTPPVRKSLDDVLRESLT